MGWGKEDDEEGRLVLRRITHVYFDVNPIRTLGT